jgi:glucokinase
VDGKIWTGFRETAGSMGWLTMDMSDRGDAELGWFERMASGTAITNRAKTLSPPLNSVQLFEAAGEKMEAKQMVEAVGHCLGTGIANLASILDPEIVIVGGGVSQQLSYFKDSIEEAMKRYASPATRSTPVVPAQLENRAGVLGALRLVF